MKRVGIYFKLKAGKRQEYVEAHDNIWPEVRETLTEAGICNYSIWNIGEMLFSYYEVEDETKMEQVLSCSEAYRKWREFMEEFVYKEEITEQKEWPLEMVFYNEGKKEV